MVMPYPVTGDSSSSPLLSLPPELRENIWRLVLGVEGQTIHLYRHEIKGENRNASPLQLDATTGKRYSLKPSCCRRKKHAWDDAYLLSQLAEDFSTDARDRRGRPKEDAKGVLPPYNARHRHCRLPDVQCLPNGEHTLQCRCSRVALGVDCICTEPSHVDLNLLRVCRSIYFEAAHLPYKLNTFSFPTAENLAFFAEILQPWQRSIIQKIEVVSEPPIAHGDSTLATGLSDDQLRPLKPNADVAEVAMEDLIFDYHAALETSLNLFPGLRELRLSVPFVKSPFMAKLQTPESTQSTPLDLPIIPKVEVIVGEDTDRSPEYESGSREERRELAEAIEGFLQGVFFDGDDRSLEWWRYLLSNGRVVPCTDY